MTETQSFHFRNTRIRVPLGMSQQSLGPVLRTEIVDVPATELVEAVAVVDERPVPVGHAVVAGRRDPDDARGTCIRDPRVEVARPVAGREVVEAQRRVDDVHALVDRVLDRLRQVRPRGDLDQIEVRARARRRGRSPRRPCRGSSNFGDAARVGLEVDEVLGCQRAGQVAGRLPERGIA